MSSEQELIRQLSANQYSKILRAIRALGDTKSTEAVPHLIELLGDSYDEVAYTAATSLGVIGDLRAVEPLTDLLTNPKGSVRVNAAWALGKIGDPRAIPHLIERLEDASNEVKENAAWALKQIGFDKISLVNKIHCLLISKNHEEIIAIGEDAVTVLIELGYRFSEISSGFFACIDVLKELTLEIGIKKVSQIFQEFVSEECKKGKDTKHIGQKTAIIYSKLLEKLRGEKIELKGKLSEGVPKPPAGQCRRLLRARRSLNV